MVIVLFIITMIKRSEFVIQRNKKGVRFVRINIIVTRFAKMKMAPIIFAYKMTQIMEVLILTKTVDTKYQLKQI